MARAKDAWLTLPSDDNERSGTHQGRLSVEARQRRAAKNARNESRRGQATHPRGSQRKGALHLGARRSQRS